jgi:hypothetical protein
VSRSWNADGRRTGALSFTLKAQRQKESFVNLFRLGSVALVLGAALEAGAESRPEALAAVTEGLSIRSHASGDLNGDGLADAAVLVAPKPVKDEPGPVALRIYFADKGGKLTLATEAPGAACHHCGGAKGGDDPYTVRIEKGMLRLRYEGGSRTTTSLETRWRHDKGDFVLVGISEVVQDTIASTRGQIAAIRRDANLATLKMEERIERVPADVPDGGSRRTIAETKRCDVDRKYRGIRVASWNHDNVDVPRCSNVEL